MRLSTMLGSLAAAVTLSAVPVCGETSVFSLWLAYDGFWSDTQVNGVMVQLFRPVPVAGSGYADAEFAQPGVAGFGLGLWGSETLDFDGVQLGGVWSRSRELDGVQLSGLANGCGERMRGVQIAGIANGVASDMRGIQLAGLVNSCDNMEGVQAAGAVNRVKTGRGVQIGLVNLCGDSDETGIEASYPSSLIQIGLLNRNHHGWWCPVVNFSWPSARHAVKTSK